ncbi:hypothetical protein D623_10034440 [Myotis brandtii]|uniref:Uncharacterized protein n=1 Tax=Myotis brandtii TaxID=109478 RepID=S7PLR7_MYOBR|nr:hypothetical protein D623_10034440 [Myotis brandtii]
MHRVRFLQHLSQPEIILRWLVRWFSFALPTTKSGRRQAAQASRHSVRHWDLTESQRNTLRRGRAENLRVPAHLGGIHARPASHRPLRSSANQDPLQTPPPSPRGSASSER